MLSIKNLSVNYQDKQIIKSLSLDLLPGKLTMLLGPNGSGKSTLLYALLGHPQYKITAGNILLDGQDITNLQVEQKAKLGLFLVSQQAPVLNGVTVLEFLSQAYRFLVSDNFKISELSKIIELLCKKVGLTSDFIERYVNVGFSGGERKKFEMLQLLLFKPKIVLLDELDSGLDYDAQKLFASILQELLFEDPDRSILCISHHKSIAQLVKPEKVLILRDGEIIASGNLDLISKIESDGYKAISFNN